MSRDSLVPGLLLAMVAAAETELAALDVTVSLGFDGTADGGDYLWIGVEDPFSASLGPAASASQEWAGSQRQTGRNESGDVWCCIESWNGEGRMADALTRCHAILAPFASWLRAADNADVPGLLHVGVANIATDLALSGTDAVARLVVRVHFEGRI